MLTRISFLAIALIFLVWFWADDDGLVRASTSAKVQGDGLTQPGHSRGIGTIPSGNSLALFGLGANPFERLDCNSKFQTTACNPDDLKSEYSESAPVTSLIRNQSQKVISGNYAVMEDLMSNVRECNARSAYTLTVAELSGDSAVVNQVKDWMCDANISKKLVTEVKLSLEGALRNNNSSAKIAYAELLRSDLLEAIAALYLDNARGVDPVFSKAAVVAKKAELLIYLKSGSLDKNQSEPLIASTEQLEAEQ